MNHKLWNLHHLQYYKHNKKFIKVIEDFLSNTRGILKSKFKLVSWDNKEDFYNIEFELVNHYDSYSIINHFAQLFVFLTMVLTMVF